MQDDFAHIPAAYSSVNRWCLGEFGVPTGTLERPVADSACSPARLGRQQGALRIRGMAGTEEEKPSRPSPLRVAIKREGAGVVPVRAPDCFLE